MFYKKMVLVMLVGVSLASCSVLESTDAKIARYEKEGQATGDYTKLDNYLSLIDDIRVEKAKEELFEKACRKATSGTYLIDKPSMEVDTWTCRQLNY